MDIPVFKIFAIFGIVSAWAAKALDDNKVTLKEAVELAEPLAEVLGIQTHIDLEEPEAVDTTPEEVPASFDKVNPELKKEPL